MTWNKDFNGVHLINVYAGMEANAQDRSNNSFQGWGMQYDNGEIPYFDYYAFKKMRESNSDYYSLTNTRRRMLAYFATATYSYKGRYSLNGTIRYEGTNRLGKRVRRVGCLRGMSAAHGMCTRRTFLNR